MEMKRNILSFPCIRSLVVLHKGFYISIYQHILSSYLYNFCVDVDY